jgi:HNH endonuclease
MYPILRTAIHTFHPDRYFITTNAEVFDAYRNRWVKVGYRKSAAERAKRPHQNYKRVQLINDHGVSVSCLLHVLMWYAAHPDTPWYGYEVDHKDSNPENNHLDNLIALHWQAHREKTVTRQRTLIHMEHVFPNEQGL